MLTSTDFSGLFNQRFFNNFLPIPATNKLYSEVCPPDFELPLVNGEGSIRLSSYRGKQPVVLEFTRIFTEKQYCPLCFPHIKAMNEAYEQFREAGAELLIVTSTDLEQSKIVVRDLGLKMPLLSDPTCAVFRAYGTGQALGAPLPAQYILDKEGKLRFKHLFSFLDPNAGVERLLEGLAKL
ncbi:peroxiredoxin family protein [Phormidium sp. CCY1219]|uniref:peroxiredoxin family protein n=1 Tax=Phormidium sp. CCY1219 TaxID=2886104 RepID=UPI002D1F6102|nr:redoxin domain-containing protein [Phormidium sp. CCY1219]MEB3829813.1 redoxin domain-containing protein [Phormidium sp. CCY1219]